MVDLLDPRTFHHWYQTQLDDGRSPENLLAELSTDSSDWSLCRQVCMAHWSDLWKIRDDLTNKAIFSKDLLIEAYAVSLDAYRQVAKFNTAADGYNVVAQQYLPMLEGYIAKITKDGRNPLVSEVEASLLSACGLIYFELGDLEKAAVECSQAIYWIKKIGANFLLSKCRSLFVTIKSSVGSLDEALSTIDEERTNVSRAKASVPFQEQAYASMLFHLGHTDQPIQRLEQLEKETELNIQGEVRNVGQRIRCLLGYDDGSSGVDDAYKNDPRGWIIHSVGKLVEYNALPNTMSSKKVKEALLREVIDLWHDNISEEYIWLATLGHWITGTANLWLGQISLANTSLNSMKVELEDTQWFDLRVRRAGLGLELALSLHNPELNPHPFVEELKRVFAEAGKLKVASKRGLVERLIYWHPVAAAFVGIIPDGIAELQIATRAIIHSGYRNSVHGILLPPAYGAELICRSLELDRIAKYYFTQADPGGGRLRRNQLLQARGNVNHWLPSISPIKLIYGLKKISCSETALRLASEYGLLPNSSAEYSMMAPLERVGLLTNQLLLDKLSIYEFCSSITNPD